MEFRPKPPLLLRLAETRSTLWIVGALALFLIALASVQPTPEPGPASVLRPTSAATVLAAPPEFVASVPLHGVYAPEDAAVAAGDVHSEAPVASHPSTAALALHDLRGVLENGPFALGPEPGATPRVDVEDLPVRSNLERVLGRPRPEVWGALRVEELCDVDALERRLAEGRLSARWSVTARLLVAGRRRPLVDVVDAPLPKDLDRVWNDPELRGEFTLLRELAALEEWLTTSAPSWPAPAVDAALAELHPWFHRYGIDMADAFALVERARLSTRPQSLSSPFRARRAAARQTSLERAEELTGKPFPLFADLGLATTD